MTDVQTRLVDQFLDMVKISSPSRHEGQFAAYMQKELEALGFSVEFDRAGEPVGGDTGNLIATLEGNPAMEPLAFSSHMDTVTPCENINPIIKDGVIYSDGTTILSADDKSGIAAIVEGIRRVLESQTAHGLIQVILTIGEETGLYGAKRLDYSKIKAKRFFVFDSSGDVGKIIVKAPASDEIRAIIHGRTAHAGLAPEQGISAIQVAARAIDSMSLLRIDPETTANIGMIHGGEATNIVAGEVQVIAEARSLDNHKLAIQSQHMKACFEEAARAFGATADVHIDRRYDAFNLSEDSPVVLQCIAAMKKLGLSPQLVSTGGGSDCNILNANGLAAVNLSTGMTSVHTTQEHIKLEALETAARLVQAIIEESIQTD